MLTSTMRRRPCVLAVLFMLISGTVLGYRRSSEDSSRKRADNGGCREGWLQSHGYCLYPTHLSQPEAEVFCEQEGALEAQGICIRKPFTDSSASVTATEDVQPEKSSAVSTKHECPKGWTRLQDYCFFSPPAFPQICHLLGAKHVLGYCVTSVPSQLSEDFMRAVKRLDGDDYNMHRDTRYCCCFGGGMCK